LNEVVLHRPSRERYASQKPHGALMMAPPPRRGSGECAVPPLEIGVQAVSLSPYRTGLAGPHRTRLPMSPAFPTCSCSLGLSPSGKSMTQEPPFELLLTVSRIQHRVPRRTLSPHNGLAAANVSKPTVAWYKPYFKHLWKPILQGDLVLPGRPKATQRWSWSVTFPKNVPQGKGVPSASL